jgi:hypothetical protein
METGNFSTKGMFFRLGGRIMEEGYKGYGFFRYFGHHGLNSLEAANTIKAAWEIFLRVEESTLICYLDKGNNELSVEEEQAITNIAYS